MVQRIIYTSVGKPAVESVLDSLDFGPYQRFMAYPNTRPHNTVNHGHVLMASTTHPSDADRYGAAHARTRINLHEARMGEPETPEFSMEGARYFSRLLEALRSPDLREAEQLVVELARPSLLKPRIVTTLGEIVDF